MSITEGQAREWSSPTAWANAPCGFCGQRGLHACPSVNHQRCECHACTMARLDSFTRDRLLRGPSLPEIGTREFMDAIRTMADAKIAAKRQELERLAAEAAPKQWTPPLRNLTLAQYHAWLRGE